ncbi:centrosomal protein POC5-like [Ostrea edulis]|uniref:centrosomal protein POC5-like n=1 Tax=Ostrea edulis TaxID=37623 RepID=UPI0024AEA3DD|nr:centrosomal protein POC5-like [Ostrea edulis]
MSSVDEDSVPELPPDSPGSSVSSRLMEEYEELLKHAVVVPTYDPKLIPQTFAEVIGSFPQVTREKLVQVQGEEESEDDADTTPVVVKVTRESELPDFGQSPIDSQHSELSDQETPRNTRSAEEQKKIPPPLFHSKNTSHSDHDEGQRSFHSEGQRSFRNEGQSSFQREQNTVEMEYVSSVDPDVTKMESMLDQWTLDLKKNVLTEFSQAKIRIVERSKHTLIREQQCSASERTSLQNEIERMKELLHTYEASVQRKDQVISNLTQALSKQREKQDALRTFSDWKIQHIDLKREKFAEKLAKRYHERRLQQKVWEAWHLTIENKWRARVEKACQAKAQEVCVQLTNDYEAKIAALTESLDAAREEICDLHKERDQYEEAMKKAFMRGVCALNLEAMTIFNKDDQKENKPSGEFSDNLESSLPEKDLSAPKTIPQEPVFTSHLGHEVPTPRIITSQGSRSNTVSSMAQSKANMAASKMSGSQRTKLIPAKVTSKIDSHRPSSGGGIRTTRPASSVGSRSGELGISGVAPPMSSVIVERHQPVSKETIGKATAVKYPSKKTSTLAEYSQGGVSHRKIAGQTSGPAHLQTVKVVD